MQVTKKGYHQKYEGRVGIPDRVGFPRQFDTHIMGVFLEEKVRNQEQLTGLRTVDLFRMKRVGDRFKWCKVHNSVMYRYKEAMGL